MNTLTVDIGNHRVKTEIWDDREVILREDGEDIDLDGINQKVKEYEIKGIIVSSVRKDSGIYDALREKSGCDVVVDFNKEITTALRTKIDYDGNVGSDRVAAYIGAETLIPAEPKLIIDAGTAITLDIVDGQGFYRGGNISPGLYQRVKSLAENTGLLPLVENFSHVRNFGHDTAGAIKAGCLNSVTGEILYTINLAKREYGVTTVILTGGDRDIIEKCVKESGESIMNDACLVGRGLNAHLRDFFLT